MDSDPKTFTVRELMDRGVLDVNDGYRAKNSELSPLGLPFARAGNISAGFQFSDADRFPESSLPRVGKKVSPPGDVVFTSKGIVGRFAFVREDTEAFVYSPQLCFWRSLDPDPINPRFLYYWMHGPSFLDQVCAVKGQPDMADYVSLRDERAFNFSIPEIIEQRAIASVLGALDDKIEANRALNETLEATCRALFRSWFVEFDPVVAKAEGRRPLHLTDEVAALFPGHFEDNSTWGGAIPFGWKIQPLDTIADYENGLPLQKHRPAPGAPRLPVIKIAQLRADAPSEDEWVAVNIKPSYILDDGDVVFSWSGSLMRGSRGLA